MGCDICSTHDIKQCLIKNSSPTLMPEIMINKLSDTIVRIELGKKISTGFFMKINTQKRIINFLITCEHSIPQEDINSKQTIKIFYGKKNEETEKEIELDDNKRLMKSYKKFDTTLIEIIEEDNIPENKYLYPDLNYINGYEQYKKIQIYVAGYPNVNEYKGDKHFSSGEIKGINEENGKFMHNCDTREGSSGSPLINSNQKVIGIHFGCNNLNTTNYGTFIGVIIENLKLEEDKVSIKKLNNLKIYKN